MGTWHSSRQIASSSWTMLLRLPQLHLAPTPPRWHGAELSARKDARRSSRHVARVAYLPQWPDPQYIQVGRAAVAAVASHARCRHAVPHATPGDHHLVHTC